MTYKLSALAVFVLSTGRYAVTAFRYRAATARLIAAPSYAGVIGRL